ncbi:MAG: prepilin-type N-terminal cleavage/methylation domain-containing protein [Chloroflexota bacterium]
MKLDEKGFTLIELVVVGGTMALIMGAASLVLFHVVSDTQRTSDHITTVHQTENAGYWISRDTQMAEGITAEGLSAPEFLVLRWTDWGYGEDTIYHVVSYSIEDLSDGIGDLKRTHQDSSGANEERIVAENIYYNPSDPENTTQVSYENEILNLRVVTIFGESQESKEYQTCRRPDLVSP